MASPAPPSPPAPYPSGVLTELIQQHEALREIMDRCEELADELDAGHCDPEQLTHEVAKLRAAFDTHNQFEEQLLRPVLLEMDAFGDVRIDRMVSNHVDEHHAVHVKLEGPTGELRGAIDQLRVHLDAEERYFLTSKVLHDDTIVVESGG